MSTAAVQPEIDALTKLKDSGIILDFEFKGQPSPRFEVVLAAMEWDESTNGWTKEGKAREAALDKAMNDLEWGFDDHVELDNEDTERWVYKFHGEAKSTIPGGHYRCVDASGHDGEGWDVQADSPREAAQAFVDDGDFEPRNRTVWIHVRVESPDGDVGTYKIKIEPVGPPCTVKDGHLWLDPRHWGSGAGVLVEETCDHCGRKKTINTGGHDPVDGSPATVVSYEVEPEVEDD